MLSVLRVGYEQTVEKDRPKRPMMPAEDTGEGAQDASSAERQELAAELRRIRLAAGLSRIEIALLR